MLYSGHTYFTILYILALCELVRKAAFRESLENFQRLRV